MYKLKLFAHHHSNWHLVISSRHLKGLMSTAAIHHEDGVLLDVIHQDGDEIVKLLDVFGNSESWIDERYALLDEKWVKKGLGEDLEYRVESERTMTIEPETGWTPSSALKAWRNNVGPTTSKWPEDIENHRPASFDESDFRGPKYESETDATRRTAFWFNIERKWKVCKYDPFVHSTCTAAIVDGVGHESKWLNAQQAAAQGWKLACSNRSSAPLPLLRPSPLLGQRCRQYLDLKKRYKYGLAPNRHLVARYCHATSEAQ